MSNKKAEISKNFEIVSRFTPTGDQPKAIKELTNNILLIKQKEQLLLGATGTGKTFTMSHIIANLNKPTLILAPNKTLAMQLFGEFKELFPNNKVEYFVSFFDYYRPEAYIAKSNTYINKLTQHNKELRMLRLSTVNALLTRKDVIVVASVAAIYGAFNPALYKSSFLYIETNNKDMNWDTLIDLLMQIDYTEHQAKLKSATFQIEAEILWLVPSWNKNFVISIVFDNQKTTITQIIEYKTDYKTILNTYDDYFIFPARDYLSGQENISKIVERIEDELESRLLHFHSKNEMKKYERLATRVREDVKNLKMFKNCAGVENYSFHLDLRNDDEPPYTLIDYFGDDFITFIDESHIAIPQIDAMYHGDQKRKASLVEYGFRLPSALKNRPLTLAEVNEKLKNIIYVTATPADYELKKVNHIYTEQLIRPTGLLDPTIEINDTKTPIKHLIVMINERVAKNERVFVIATTIQMVDDLTLYLQGQNIKAQSLHSRLTTINRSQILLNLRKGIFDVVVGVNLLREGLDIPEVSLVCILEADKEGFLRSKTSLIQTIGRAARNINGHVILYAQQMTKSIKDAIDETCRRRESQEIYNKSNQITPRSTTRTLTELNFYNEDLPGNKVLTKSKFKCPECKNILMWQSDEQANQDQILICSNNLLCKFTIKNWHELAIDKASPTSEVKQETLVKFNNISCPKCGKELNWKYYEKVDNETITCAEKKCSFIITKSAALNDWKTFILKINDEYQSLLNKQIKALTIKMNQAAKTSDFEKAIKLRNYIFNLNKKLENLK